MKKSKSPITLKKKHPKLIGYLQSIRVVERREIEYFMNDRRYLTHFGPIKAKRKKVNRSLDFSPSQQDDLSPKYQTTSAHPSVSPTRLAPIGLLT